MNKINESHLRRKAYIYIRQSSLVQVQHHQESTRRQYRLYERALRLGWPQERIEIIDEDQGKSGASAQLRSGLSRLVSEVAWSGLAAFLDWKSAAWRAHVRLVPVMGSRRFIRCTDR